MEQELEKVGLNKNEVKVYLSILKLGTSTAGEITKESKLYRRGVYEALKTLEEKNLITSIVKDYKKHFAASKPKHLLDTIKEKEEIIKSIIPSILRIKSKKEIEPKIEIRTGLGGFKALVEEQLTSKELLGIGITLKSLKILQYYLPHIIKRGKKIGAKAKLIIYEEVKEPLLNLIKKNVKLKIIPRGFYVPSTTMIWGDKVSISLLEEKPFVIIIENKTINEAYKKYFNYMWNLTK